MAKKKAARKKTTPRKKKATRKKPAASTKAAGRPGPELPAEIVEAAVLLLVRHRDGQAAGKQLGERHGADQATAEAAVAEARRQLTVAAGYDRVEELGRAIARLNDLYESASRAVTGGEREECPECGAAIAVPAKAATFTAANNIQKEINRLLDLYRPVDLPGAETSEESAELRLIREYLEPYELGDPTLPAAELVRLALGRLKLP